MSFGTTDTTGVWGRPFLIPTSGYLDNWTQARIAQKLAVDLPGDARAGAMQLAIRDVYNECGVARAEAKAVGDCTEELTLGVVIRGRGQRALPTRAQAARFMGMLVRLLRRHRPNCRLVAALVPDIF